jgi:hypothetical protein
LPPTPNSLFFSDISINPLICLGLALCVLSTLLALLQIGNFPSLTIGQIGAGAIAAFEIYGFFVVGEASPLPTPSAPSFQPTHLFPLCSSFPSPLPVPPKTPAEHV